MRGDFLLFLEIMKTNPDTLPLEIFPDLIENIPFTPDTTRTSPLSGFSVDLQYDEKTTSALLNSTDCELYDQTKHPTTLREKMNTNRARH